MATASSSSIPAPIGGLNTRDSVDLVGETDALRLDNFFPARSYVHVRSGFSAHVTGLPSTVESLMTYSSGTADQLFAASGTAIYNVTSAGAVGSAVVTSLTNARFQHVNITTSGGSYLWICNGADAPRHWNGSAWATPTLSGVTAANIINVEVFKERLLFVFNDSLTFGYLGTNAIAGSTSTFSLGSVFSRGGELTAIGTWTRDGGAGPDDVAVFYTSEGEIAIYSGTNPASADTWALSGVFTVGRPIGRRCMVKAGSDLYLITENGVLPMTQVLGTGEAAPNRAISDKISATYSEAVDNYASTFGWEGMIYPRGGYGLFNVPASTGGEFNQLIVNLDTGAWSRFRDQNAYSWALLSGDPYFGGSTKVFKADTGLSDDGSTIDASAKTGFFYFGQRSGPKRFTAVRPVFASDSPLTVSLGFDVDYKDGTSAFTASTGATGGATWGSATWDVAEWGGAITTTQDWQSVADIGWNAAVRVRTSTDEQFVRWLATDLLYEIGAGL